jgi:predicted S18 family serine protease
VNALYYFKFRQERNLARKLTFFKMLNLLKDKLKSRKSEGFNKIKQTLNSGIQNILTEEYYDEDDSMSLV